MNKRGSTDLPFIWIVVIPITIFILILFRSIYIDNEGQIAYNRNYSKCYEILQHDGYNMEDVAVFINSNTEVAFLSSIQKISFLDLCNSKAAMGKFKKWLEK